MQSNESMISKNVAFPYALFIKVAQYSLKKMENSRLFLDNYYLLINKKYLTYIKQHLKSLNFCTKVTQLPLLWQQ